MSDNLFDVETDFALSQINLEEFLVEEEKRGNFPYSQSDLDDFSLTKKQKADRFNRPATENEVLAVRNKSFVKNTVKNTNWAVNTFDQWGNWRNSYVLKHGQPSSEPFSLVPPLTAELTATELDFWLCKFVVEVKRQDGSEYPPDSLKLLCIGIWRYLRDTCRRYDLNPFNTDNAAFANFQHTLDGKMKESESKTPHVKKQAEPISDSEEEKLWEKVFSLYEKDAKKLSYAVYYYNCKIFALRAADEHADLDRSQFSISENEYGEYIHFQGATAKNCQGGIYHKKSEKKSIKQYGQIDNPRCVVKLFKFYLSVIPSSGAFYRRPLAGITSSGEPKFSKQKIGRHTLQGYMGEMCKIADISGRKTGHSGKVTTATKLFQKNFDEQLIKQRTGHKSDAVRSYKRTSEEQVKEISDALQPTLPKQATRNTTSTSIPSVNITQEHPTTSNGECRNTTCTSVPSVNIAQEHPTISNGECRIKIKKGDISVDFTLL